MVDGGGSDGSGKRGWVRDNVFLAGAGILAIGMVAGGYLLGDGLLRAKQADRSVTVRGLAEKDVTADLATWTIAYSAQADDLASAQADIDADTKALRGFFTSSALMATRCSPRARTSRSSTTITDRPRTPSASACRCAPTTSRRRRLR